jgi:hypothetical protein
MALAVGRFTKRREGGVGVLQPVSDRVGVGTGGRQSAGEDADAAAGLGGEGGGVVAAGELAGAIDPHPDGALLDAELAATSAAVGAGALLRGAK